MEQEVATIAYKEEFISFLREKRGRNGKPRSEKGINSYMSYLKKTSEALQIIINPSDLNTSDQLQDIFQRLESSSINSKTVINYKSALRDYYTFSKHLLATKAVSATRLGKVWNSYINAMEEYRKAFGVNTNNILGSVAEQIACKYFKGELPPPSTKSYDFTANGEKYQVKARILQRSTNTTKLGIIRDKDFEFNYLIVILFTYDGKLFDARKINKADLTAYTIANIKEDHYQKGYSFTTTKEFLKLGASFKEPLAQQFGLETK